MKKTICVLLVLCLFLSLALCSDILGGAVFLFLAATGDDSDGNEKAKLHKAAWL